MDNDNQNSGIYDQLAERGIILPRPKPDRMSEEMQSCKFSREELLDLGQRLARTTDQKRQAESDKSQVVKQYAARIAGCDTEIGDLSQKLSNGYEWRKVECATFFDHPQKGMATTFRLDTGEEITSRRMTYDELQLGMNLAPAAEAPKEPDQEPDSEIIPPTASDTPIRQWSMRKRGAALVLDIYAADDGGFVWDAQFGPDTGDDGNLELFDGAVNAETTVEAAIIAACTEIEHHARLKAGEVTGKEKSAWALVLSWAVEIAGEARVALRTADEGAAA